MLDPAEIAPDAPRLLTRGEYERLVELGLFEGERVELLYGTVVTMSPHGPGHDESVGSLAERLVRALGQRARVRVQSAFAASDGSEPEPDIAVVPARSYREAHPTEAFLIVEVADSSLAKDRGPKARLYAESGVEEYWVANLVERTVEVHRGLAQGRYSSVEVRALGQRLVPSRYPDIELAVQDVLGLASD